MPKYLDKVYSSIMPRERGYVENMEGVMYGYMLELLGRDSYLEDQPAADTDASDRLLAIGKCARERRNIAICLR